MTEQLQGKRYCVRQTQHHNRLQHRRTGQHLRYHLLWCRQELLRYFQQLYNNVRTGGQEIQKLRQAYDYPKVAECFCVIDNDCQQSVVVSWQEGIDLIAEFRDKNVLSSQDWQRLQKYTVGLPHSYQQVVVCSNGLHWICLDNYNTNFGIEA